MQLCYLYVIPIFLLVAEQLALEVFCLALAVFFPLMELACYFGNLVVLVCYCSCFSPWVKWASK